MHILPTNSFLWSDVSGKGMLLFQKIVAFLNEHHCHHSVLEHVAVRTSLEAAQARGEPLKIGAKALVLKDEKQFFMVVIPADRRLETGKVKKTRCSRNLRFASPEELLEINGLVPGSVPPFGNIIGLQMMVDQHVFDNEFMAFNAGSLEKSIKMKTADYRSIVHPEVGDFSQ